MNKIKAFYTKYKDKLMWLIKAMKMPSFAIVIGFFGAFAGSHGTSKAWRRILIPAINTVASILTSLVGGSSWYSLWHLTCMAQCGAYSMGYGIPDDDYPVNPNADEGSDIGRFFTMLFRKWYSIQKAHRIADYFTRSLIALFKVGAVVSIPIIKGNWLCYVLGGLGVVLTNALISWRGWGSFKVKIINKEVEFLWSDIINYTIEGLCYYIMIFWSIL